MHACFLLNTRPSAPPSDDSRPAHQPINTCPFRSPAAVLPVNLGGQVRPKYGPQTWRVALPPSYWKSKRSHRPRQFWAFASNAPPHRSP